MRHLGTARWLLITGAMIFANHSAFADSPPGAPQNVPCRTCCPPGTVFVANTGGDCEHLTDKLRRTFARNAVPYRIVTLNWTGDEGKIHDYHDIVNQRMAGARLAGQVLACRRSCPDCKIVLIGYGAGAGVILSLAENLPAGTVDRIILLGAAVPSNYNLCGALRSSREGIDSFFSREDNILEFAESTFGLPGKQRTPAAGRVGFQRACCPEGAKLRQYGWTTKWDDKGHHGGHCGYRHVRFLQLNVLPLLKGEFPVVASLR
jgi:pimeloyl-ACP methyl ester carboxylesterase